MNKKNYLSVYAKSFNWAGFFLPRKTYQKCSALYDFCRTVDNIADEEGEIEIKFVPIRPGEYDFEIERLQNKGMVGKFIVE